MPSYQEDGHNVSCISIDPEELRLSVKQAHNIEWDVDGTSKEIASQVVFVGIYDGYVVKYITLLSTLVTQTSATAVRPFLIFYGENYILFLNQSTNLKYQKHMTGLKV